MNIFRKTIHYAGNDQELDLKTGDEKEILPIGLSKITTDGYLSVAFITIDNHAKAMFVLTPGTHRVLKPKDVFAVFEADKKTKWTVIFPNRFDESDPTRVASTMIRPLTEAEELAAYNNELAARVLTKQRAHAIRSGKAEFDFTGEDYSEDLEDDYDSPLSVHQMSLIMDQIQADMIRKQESDASPPAEQRVDGEKPTEKTETRGDGNPKQADIED